MKLLGHDRCRIQEKMGAFFRQGIRRLPGTFQRSLPLAGPADAAGGRPDAADFFCFQKRVVKDAELFEFHESAAQAPKRSERGFADVWKKDCFAWEYKGKKKNLDEAYKQLLRYRESLLNPPLAGRLRFRPLHRPHQLQRHGPGESTNSRTTKLTARKT